MAPVRDANNPGSANGSTTEYREYFPDTAWKYKKKGRTFMETFNSDKYAHERELHLYYPFASADEWQLASFVERSKMFMAQIDEFLKLHMTQKLNLSFKTAMQLRSNIELLPAGPQWKVMTWDTKPYPTKKPLTLYYRDPLECLQSLLSNPLVQDFIYYTPFRLWETSAKLMRIYTEWLSGDTAWKYQELAQEGATVLGSIITSDKTQLTSMTGNRQAHPVLISLANLLNDFRSKACYHAFLLLCLLPIAKFLEKNQEIRAVLLNRLFHAIMDFVLGPLKKTAEIGQMMTDPLGWPHTLSLLRDLEAEAHPWEQLAGYVKAAKKLGLNGVHEPFWRDWSWAEPAIFLAPEVLHYWLKFFYDHLVKWCIEALGAEEIDFRFSVLRPHTGMRHFKEGISKAKQTTGREHRDIMLNSTSKLLAQIDPVQRLSGTNRACVNYFLTSKLLAEGRFPNAPFPFRTFSSLEGNIAFHLSRDPSYCQLAVDSAALKFTLPDFRPALASYLHLSQGSQITIGGKRPNLVTDVLPFDKVECWDKVRMQSHSFHKSDKILVPETVNASPPNSLWKFGWADTVIVNTDSQSRWPQSGLPGHTVCQLRMIFRVVPRQDRRAPPGAEGFLVYVQRFDIVHQQNPAGPGTGTFPDPSTGMYLLKRARRGDNSPKGDIVPLNRLRAAVELTPHFGKKADTRLTKETSLDYGEKYWLTKWFNKELFYALDQ
ncbi:hypothetical protein K438DRAFT_1619422 [Mycena galopus ATCC 62051]|nr:hypothetical protein K438DRAFT_1619422 [Mycena galopus ATCC 62051]